MSDFDDLPRRDDNHVTEEKALTAFQTRLLESGAFILQTADRKDYGTDCQIEVAHDGSATNARIQVQLKGTGQPLNRDGSVSVVVSRANLNYLLAQKHSFYVCFHVPTASIRFCFADAVMRQYEHGGSNWTKQGTVTVNFTEELTVEALRALAMLALHGSRESRDDRLGQVVAPPAELARLLRRQVPSIHVPEDRPHAAYVLEQLYERGADEVISAAFGRFAAVLGANSEEIGYGYMAEINLGMARRSDASGRIEEAIGYFRSRLAGGRYHRGSLNYTIGNALSALGREDEARREYESAFEDRVFMSSAEMAAQLNKNLGTSMERLGEQDLAVAHYQEALRLAPELPEAHNALGNYYIRVGRYQEALEHLDRVVVAEHQQGMLSAIAGWRVNVLFNLGDGRGAFREINALLSRADDHPWIWPWCARQVTAFGRASVANARQAVNFWQRYIAVHPDVAVARQELLLAQFYLRQEGEELGVTYAAFREEFDRQIARIDDTDAALVWDRLGHWAQDEGDWAEAERCFRRAYDLERGHYGYCLGTALNFLDRFEEALPILTEQAHALQPDAMSWFQVAVAQSGLGRSSEAVAAYRKAIELNPDYPEAMFNLGGTLWNTGDTLAAQEAWSAALERFPDHRLSEDVLRVMPGLARRGSDVK
jgi:tetratricopeptide (TPR) repeat protein